MDWYYLIHKCNTKSSRAKLGDTGKKSCEYVFNCEGQTDVNLSNKTLLEIMDSFEKYKVQDQ
jgi:hypothetical protein